MPEPTGLTTPKGNIMELILIGLVAAPVASWAFSVFAGSVPVVAALIKEGNL